MLLPIAVGDYVDFYSSIHHAANLGRMMRPDADPHPPQLAPPARRLPRPGRHGAGQRRATSSGPRVWCPTPTACPGCGPRRRSTSSSRWASSSVRGGHPHPAGRRRSPRVRRGAAQRLVGPGHPGLRVPAARAQPGQELRHDDLAVGRHPRRAAAVPGRPPVQDPTPDPYLQAQRPWALDLHLEVELNGERDRARTDLRPHVLDLRPAARPHHRQRGHDRAPATCSARARSAARRRPSGAA